MARLTIIPTFDADTVWLNLDYVTAVVDDALDKKIKVWSTDGSKEPMALDYDTDDGITIHGIPFADAGQAAQVRVAITLAVRQSPRLRDVWIRLGALFDDEAIEAMRQLAAELDCRVWLEVVGERGHGERAIVIREGRVAGAGGEA